MSKAHVFSAVPDAVFLLIRALFLGWMRRCRGWRRPAAGKEG